MEKTENDKKPSDDEKRLHKFSSPWHFSDVVLVVEGTKFHVHRSTLSMWSPVFEKMFTSEFSEKNAQEIPLPGKRAEEVEQLLQMIYSSDAKQEVTETNYEFLLELAREYQMDRVQQYCTQYMKQDINDQNCLHRYKIAERYEFKDAMEKCNEEARFKSSADLEKSTDFRDLGLESKFELCMARIKELENALTQYAGICTRMVNNYYQMLSSNMPKLEPHIRKRCDNESSHSSRPGFKARKEVDSSCKLCRKTINRCLGVIEIEISAKTNYHYDFAKLNDLEHNDGKVAKIIKQMKVSKPSRYSHS